MVSKSPIKENNFFRNRKLPLPFGTEQMSGLSFKTTRSQLVEDFNEVIGLRDNDDIPAIIGQGKEIMNEAPVDYEFQKLLRRCVNRGESTNVELLLENMMRELQIQPDTKKKKKRCSLERVEEIDEEKQKEEETSKSESDK